MAHLERETLFSQCISCGSGAKGAFRSIYKTPSGVRLSGIGQHESLALEHFIPTDQNATAQTMGDDYIQVSGGTDISRPNPYAFHVAFIFDLVCWDLLMDQFAPGELSLDRLFEVCKMQPKWSYNPSGSSITYDMTRVPSVQLLTRSGRRIPENDTDGMFWRDKPATDWFNKFPLEIREAIAGFLPTAGFLNLRLASRAMAVIFDNPGFWNTRFYPNEERGFMFWLLALQKNNRRYRKMDWRLIYHATNTIRVGGDRFGKRIHIWNRHRWLRDVCLMTRTTDPSTSIPSNTVSNVSQPTQDASSVIQTVNVPPSFHLIAVSVLRERKNTCITGIEFTYRDRPNINIGYKIPGRSMPVHISSLKEIQAAVGKRGVYAIRFISHTFESGWLGDRNEDRTTISRATAEGGIREMEIRFDGYRMTMLKLR